jgi:hypothetical protein
MAVFNIRRDETDELKQYSSKYGTATDDLLPTTFTEMPWAASEGFHLKFSLSTYNTKFAWSYIYFSTGRLAFIHTPELTLKSC